MPPKKQKKKKKKAIKEPNPIIEKTLKETILERHLHDITKQLEKCKVRVAELQYENASLEEEATKTRTESHEYMKYMGKKTDMRQKAVVTLSDRNRQLFRSIQEERNQLEEKYDDQKKELETILLAKKHVLHKTKNEMENLQESMYLQDEQLKRIDQLEKDVVETRNHHANSVEALKGKYINEKMKFRLEADEKLRILTKEANEEAKMQLVYYAESIDTENRSLKRQLQTLIVRNQTLLTHRQQLQEHHKTLVWKLQYNEDLKSLDRKRLQNAHQLNKDSTNTFDQLVNTKNISLKKLFSQTDL